MMSSKAHIPKGWRLVRLGDVAEVVMGQSPPGELVSDWDGTDGRNGGLPFIQGNAEFGADFPNPVKWCSQPFKVGVPGDILISVRAPVGETNRADRKLGIGRGLAAVRFNKRGQAFGWHILNHSKEVLERVTQGSTFQAIGGGELRNLPILLPPLPEQRAIAAVLDAIDDAIEGTEAVIAATEQLRDSLLHQLLTRGVPGWHTAWKEAPGPGTIPAGWEVVRLGEVAEAEQGGTPPKSRAEYWDGHIPFVTGADLRGFRISRNDARSFLTEEGLNSGATAIYKPGALMLATRTRVGLVGIASETMGVSQDITILKANEPIDSIYLSRVLTLYAPVMQRRSRGTTIQGISREDALSVPLPLPPLPEQQAIAGSLDGVDEAIGQAKHETNMLKLLKDSTADALLTGRVRVGMTL